MNDQQHCRLSIDDEETELAGPPTALRALADLIRAGGEPVSVPVIGGFVARSTTRGPLLVSLRPGPTLHFSGGREFLALVVEALQGVADEADSADDRAVNRHQHIEYYPGDEYRSPDSIPLVIVADWPPSESRDDHPERRAGVDG
jgi:hypothetical protein